MAGHSFGRDLQQYHWCACDHLASNWKCWATECLISICLMDWFLLLLSVMDRLSNAVCGLPAEHVWKIRRVGPTTGRHLKACSADLEIRKVIVFPFKRIWDFDVPLFLFPASSLSVSSHLICVPNSSILHYPCCSGPPSSLTCTIPMASYKPCISSPPSWLTARHPP